jgi:ketosteroid isomerase-like protein
MKNLFIVIVFLIGTNTAFAQNSAEERSMLDEVTATLDSDNLSLAQDAEEIRAMVGAYIEIFNARASSELAQDIFMASAQVATFVLPTSADIEELFDQLFYAGMESNWDHSTINNVDVCMAGPGLAFVDLNYSRIDDVGKQIQPAERASLLIIRETDGQWRISAVHPHDAARKVTC